MKHSRVSLRVHCIFSTKDRRPALPEELHARTWAFIGGIARNLGIKAIAVGGMADHVHILLLLPPTMPLAEAVQKIKANSSRWLREQTGQPLQWQEGYAAFSLSGTDVPGWILAGLAALSPSSDSTCVQGVRVLPQLLMSRSRAGFWLAWPVSSPRGQVCTALVESIICGLSREELRES